MVRFTSHFHSDTISAISHSAGNLQLSRSTIVYSNKVPSKEQPPVANAKDRNNSEESCSRNSRDPDGRQNSSSRTLQPPQRITQGTFLPNQHIKSLISSYLLLEYCTLYLTFYFDMCDAQLNQAKSWVQFCRMRMESSPRSFTIPKRW